MEDFSEVIRQLEQRVVRLELYFTENNELFRQPRGIDIPALTESDVDHDFLTEAQRRYERLWNMVNLEWRGSEAEPLISQLAEELRQRSVASRHFNEWLRLKELVYRLLDTIHRQQRR